MAKKATGAKRTASAKPVRAAKQVRTAKQKTAAKRMPAAKRATAAKRGPTAQRVPTTKRAPAAKRAGKPAEKRAKGGTGRGAAKASATATAGGFLEGLSNPARRALEHAGITTLRKLSARRETDVLALHGVGPSALPGLRRALAAAGLSFRG